MSYSLEIRLEALADIDEAAEWYEKHEVGLGVDFAHTVVEAIDSLLEFTILIDKVRYFSLRVKMLAISRSLYGSSIPAKGNRSRKRSLRSRTSSKA